MLTTKAHFEYFKKRVRYWYKRYNLSGWELYFGQQDIGESYARILVNLVGRVATFILTLEWQHPQMCPLKNISLDRCARHEVIHLMVGDVGILLNARFVSEDETRAAEERLVRHLEELL